MECREAKLDEPSEKAKRLSKKSKIIVRILNRSDFITVSSKFKSRSKGLNLQARRRSCKDHPSISHLMRVGITCSKKVGNAVRRNRAKRKLRHIARDCLPEIGRTGWDYVLIGHYRDTEEMNFNDLKKSFIKVIHQVHKYGDQA